VSLSWFIGCWGGAERDELEDVLSGLLTDSVERERAKTALRSRFIKNAQNIVEHWKTLESFGLRAIVDDFDGILKSGGVSPRVKPEGLWRVSSNLVRFSIDLCWGGFISVVCLSCASRLVGEIVLLRIMTVLC